VIELGFLAAFLIGMMAGGASMYLRLRDLFGRARKNIAETKRLRVDLQTQLRAANGRLEQLEHATQVMQSHIPRMHEMAMALNRVADVCSCKDCQAWRAAQ